MSTQKNNKNKIFPPLKPSLKKFEYITEEQIKTYSDISMEDAVHNYKVSLGRRKIKVKGQNTHLMYEEMVLLFKYIIDMIHYEEDYQVYELALKMIEEEAL